MADFDPDAYLAGNQAFDPDAYLGAPKTGAIESAAQGFQSGASAGWSDELSGLRAASGLPTEGVLSAAGVAGPLGGIATPVLSGAQHLIGAARLAYEHATGQRGPATQAYEQARDEIRNRQTQMQSEHPYAFGAGELGGAATTLLAAPEEAAATLPMKMLQGAKLGAAYGAASGAGEAQGAADTLSGGITGGVSGAIGGAGGALLGAGLEKAGGLAYDYFGRPIASLARGLINPEEEGMRRGAGALLKDYPQIQQGKALGLTPAEYAQALQSGEPVMAADLGGEQTRALLRSAANTSPEARNLINTTVQNRFEDQGERVANDIRNLVSGGADVPKTRADLQAAYDAQRGAAYRTAYDAGDRPLWSPTLERLASSRSVIGAIKDAVEKGNDRAVAEGYGGFNPGVNVTQDGKLVFNRGPNGVPTYPNLQFWDYTYRNLRDASGAAYRAGRNDEGSALGSLASTMRNELDRMVPSFKTARGVAADFFGGNDALEAGQAAAKFKGDPAILRQKMAQMQPSERALFQEGYADAKANDVLNVADNRDVSNRIYNSPNERGRMAAVFGQSNLKPIETRLRLERIMDLSRTALGNSTTARQLIEAGLAGGAIGGYLHGWEGALAGAGAGVAGAKAGVTNLARAGAQKLIGYVDQNTARKVAEFLTSSDPGMVQRGIQLASKNSRISDGLKAIESRLSVAGGAQQAAKQALRLTVHPSSWYAQGPTPANANQNQQNRGGRTDAKPDDSDGSNPHMAHGGRVGSQKLSHKAVGYVSLSRIPGKHCSVCTMFRDGPSCTLVVNPIYSRGMCRRFDPK